MKNPVREYINKQVEAGIEKYKESIGATGSVDKDDWQFRRLTGASDRDLSPLTQERVIEIAYKLYDQNPLAHNFVELIKDYVIGTGVTYKAEDEAVQEVLDEFWEDPINNWEIKQHDRARELSMWGEQLYPVFVNDVNGKVRMGNVDPSQIEGVMLKPGNIEVVDRVKLKSSPGEESKVMKVIHVDENAEPETQDIKTNLKPKVNTLGKLIGEAFYFRINTVSNGRRGKPDLLNGADWFDLYDQFLWCEAERAQFLRAFVWDVEIQGFNDSQIEEWKKKNPAPPPGSVVVHNEKVKWNAVTPDIKSREAEILARLIRNQIGIGLGFSEIFSGMGGDVNRATAVEMGDPTIKRMQSRQGYFKYMITQIFRFVIDQAIIHGTLSEDVNTEFTVNMTPIKIDDQEVASKVLKSITDSLALAQQNGWISKEKAGEVFAILIEPLGIEIDSREEESKVEEEDEEDENQDIKPIDMDKEKEKQEIQEAVMEALDIKKEHGHQKAKVGNVLWYFHNTGQVNEDGDHGHGSDFKPSYNHCVGGPANPYEIEHKGSGKMLKHKISKQYARGHGFELEPTWWEFPDKLDNGWEVETGKKIDVKDVPKSFK